MPKQKKSGYLTDYDPRRWLSAYQSTSMTHLLKMAFFYHIMAIGLMVLSSFLVIQVIPEYETPDLPVSIALVFEV